MTDAQSTVTVLYETEIDPDEAERLVADAHDPWELSYDNNGWSLHWKAYDPEVRRYRDWGVGGYQLGNPTGNPNNWKKVKALGQRILDRIRAKEATGERFDLKRHKNIWFYLGKLSVKEAEEFDPAEVEQVAAAAQGDPNYPKGRPAKVVWIDHGCQPADYFQGASTLGWDDVYTGSGNTPKEAAEEAFQQASDDGWNLVGVALSEEVDNDYTVEDWVRDSVDPVDIGDSIEDYISVAMLNHYVSLKLNGYK